MKKPGINIKLKLNPTNLLAFGVACCILALIGVSIYFVPKIKDNYDSFEKEEEVVSRLRNKVGVLDNLSSQKNLLNQEDVVLRNVLPDKIDIPDFMGRISKVATDSAVLIDSFQLVSAGRTSPNKRAPRSSKSVSFSLSVSGTYSEIISYVTNLENFASIVGFETVEISDTSSVEEGTTSELGLLGASFSLNAYYLPIENVEINLEKTITFSLESDSFKKAISIAKGMVYWQADQYKDPVGKSNPFLR